MKNSAHYLRRWDKRCWASDGIQTVFRFALPSKTASPAESAAMGGIANRGWELLGTCAGPIHDAIASGVAGFAFAAEGPGWDGK